MTWILGNRLITVTTSGCSNKAMRGGLCDNCWAACKPGFLLLDHTRTSHSNLQRTSSIEVFIYINVLESEINSYKYSKVSFKMK